MDFLKEIAIPAIIAIVLIVIVAFSSFWAIGKLRGVASGKTYGLVGVEMDHGVYCVVNPGGPLDRSPEFSCVATGKNFEEDDER